MRALLVLGLILLVSVPAALASRGPTKTEKTKISRAAHRSKQTDFFDCFAVDHIKVSTKGPWAIGSLRSCTDPNDVIGGVFSRKPKWKLRQTGNGSIGCDIAPKKVQRDLDLGC